MCPASRVVYTQFLGYMVFLFGSRIRIFFFIFENEVNFSIYFLFLFLLLVSFTLNPTSLLLAFVCFHVRKGLKKRFVVPIGTYQIHSQVSFPQTIRPKGFFFKPTQHAHG